MHVQHKPVQVKLFDKLQQFLARLIQRAARHSALFRSVAVRALEIACGRAALEGRWIAAIGLALRGLHIDIARDLRVARAIQCKPRLQIGMQGCGVGQSGRRGMRISFKAAIDEELHHIGADQGIAFVLGACGLCDLKHARIIDIALGVAKRAWNQVLGYPGTHRQLPGGQQVVVERQLVLRHGGIQHRGDADTVQAVRDPGRLADDILEIFDITGIVIRPIERGLHIFIDHAVGFIVLIDPHINLVSRKICCKRCL